MRARATGILLWLAVASATSAADSSSETAREEQRLARHYSDLSHDVADPAEHRRLVGLALVHAQRAAELQPDDPVTELSLAICYGKLAERAPIRTKIEYSRFVKQHAERALALAPDYDYAHHVLGRWHHEVASLSPAARWIVKLVYGGLPPASTAQAVHHLQRAAELAPQTVSHHVELGFVLLSAGKSAAARKSFQRATELPAAEKHDVIAQRRAKEALANANVRSGGD